MPKPFSGFIWVFGLTILFGILVGTLNLWNPDAVHIPFGTDDEGNALSAEGFDGLIASTLSSAVLGVIFGSFAALIAWLVGKGVDRAKS